LTIVASAPNSKVPMPNDEPRSTGALGPEEVGARVSAILEAAERDAREVIEAAYREQSEREPPPELAQLAEQVAALAQRVGALEEAVGLATPAGVSREARRASDGGRSAARVRAVELALAGLSRQQIAQELAAMLSPAEVTGLLDEVLSG
jgi:hypothetical protein